jgi:hypothetical protein
LKHQTRPPADIVSEDQQGSVYRRDLLGCLLLESSELQEGPCAPFTPRTTDIAHANAINQAQVQAQPQRACGRKGPCTLGLVA